MLNHSDLIGRKAYYRGSNRKHLMSGSIAYNIKDVRTDGLAVQFDNLLWVGIDKIELAPVDVDAVFNNAAGTAEERLDNEIARLEQRIAELKAAKAVLQSL